MVYSMSTALSVGCSLEVDKVGMVFESDDKFIKNPTNTATFCAAALYNTETSAITKSKEEFAQCVEGSDLSFRCLWW